jgi:hypothetical protein
MHCTWKAENVQLRELLGAVQQKLKQQTKTKAVLAEILCPPRATRSVIKLL